MPALLLGCSLLATAPPAYAQGPWTWSSQSVSTSPGRAWAEQNAVDAAGDVYVTGAFVGTVNFPGAGTLNSMGNSQDTFVGKLNGVTGVWMWVTQGLDPGVGSGYGICVDNAGSVYVTGKFEGTFVIFPPMPPLPGSGGNDVFVAKFDANTGQCVDRVAGGGANGNDVGRSIAWLPQIPGTPPGGLLFVTGEFTSPVAIFGSGGVGNAGGGGTSDIFVSQLSAAVLNWNNTISVGGGGDDRGQGITVAPSPSASTPPFVYVTGGFESGTIVFGGTPLTNYGSSFSDIYVGKLDVGLTWQWVSQAGGIGRDEGMDVTYDPVSADVYTTGHFEALASTAGTVATFGSFSFAPSPAYGGTDIFVARLKTPTGLWAWARQAGGVNDDTGYAIDQDPSGRIYATGTFTSGPGLFGPTTLPNTAAGIGDVFISKLANMGGWMWSRADGGPGHDEGKGIALAGPSTVFASGGFFASAQFSPFTLTSVSRDAWVGRLPGTLPNLVVNTPMNVPPGGYQNITVTGTGVAILTGPVFAAGNVIVQNGGVWTSNCNILTGPGNFQLQAGGTINICSPQGISLSGPTGDIQVTGTR
ncbi:MAG TPA: hypothetical protein VEI97_19645, partial [bacterium]|nr:hypothetical protein [bacterium]